MKRAKKRGPGPSHLLMTPDHAGNVVGIDPHKRTLTATVADARGGILASAHFRVSGEGHRELEAWARQFGQIARWGIEGSASWGRHTAMFLTGRGHDVRDVCANRTPRSDRARQRGKSDTLDSERIAREVLAHPLLPKAFKRAGQEHGPDEQHQLLALWHNRRRSILDQPPAPGQRGRAPALRAAAGAARAAARHQGGQAPARGARTPQPPPALRRADQAAPAAARRLPRADQALDREEKQVVAQLKALVRQSGSTLGELCGLTPGRSPSCWSRPATRAGSPRAGSRASTAQRRCPPRPPRGPASRSATATTPAATGGSTRSFTGWPSPSCAASHAPSASTPTRAPRSHQEGGPPRPQAPPLRRHLPAHDPRPAAQLPATPPRCMTARGRRAVKDGPSGPSAASRPAASLTATVPRATHPKGGT